MEKMPTHEAMPIINLQKAANDAGVEQVENVVGAKIYNGRNVRKATWEHLDDLQRRPEKYAIDRHGLVWKQSEPNIGGEALSIMFGNHPSMDITRIFRDSVRNITTKTDSKLLVAANDDVLRKAV